MKNFYTWFFGILILLIFISTGYYYTVFIPDQTVVQDSSFVEEDPLQILNQQLIDLEVKKNFYKNRIKLTNMDHYNLFIDLSDSIVTLEISGIIAHSASILNFEIGENYKTNKQTERIIKVLRDPFQLISEWASIPKKPIRVKDISGFEWNPDSLNFVPTKTDTDFVFIALQYSKDLTVLISQRSIVGAMPSYITPDHLNKFEKIIKQNQRSEELPFGQVLQKNWIGIEIPRSDAVILYRALSEKSLLVLCL
jgi:hypothetical protein